MRILARDAGITHTTTNLTQTQRSAGREASRKRDRKPAVAPAQPARSCEKTTGSAWRIRPEEVVPLGTSVPASRVLRARGLEDPARISKLILHITFGIHDGRGFTLASDIVMAMTNAVSLHFDFWNTWNQTVLEHEVDAGPRV